MSLGSLVCVGIMHMVSGSIHSIAFPAVVSVAGNPCLLSLLNTRILFNMKEVGERGLSQGTSLRTVSTVSEIGFTEDLVRIVDESLADVDGLVVNIDLEERA